MQRFDNKGRAGGMNGARLTGITPTLDHNTMKENHVTSFKHCFQVTRNQHS